MEAAAGPPGVVELTGPNFPVACCFSYQQVVLLKLVVCWFLCQRRLCLRGDLLGFAPLRADAFFVFFFLFFLCFWMCIMVVVPTVRFIFILARSSLVIFVHFLSRQPACQHRRVFSWIHI